jgi:hypothetical protein
MADGRSAFKETIHCQDGDMDEPLPWARRQRTALTGLVPIVALCVGGSALGSLAESIGAPYPLGAIVGGVAAFFVSRAILRRLFSRAWSDQVDSTAR